jgi:hypothetical protein
MYESSTPVPSSVFNNKKIIFWGSFSLFKLRCFIHTLGMLLITKTNRAVLHLTRLAVTIRIYKLGAQGRDEMFFSSSPCLKTWKKTKHVRDLHVKQGRAFDPII